MDIDWSGVKLGDFDSGFIDKDLQRRLRKTLYYGKNPLTDRTSLPVTELAVELLQQAAPRELGKIDTQLAASISRKACLSPCSLMLGLIYIDRLRQKSPEYLQQVSSADLFIVAMMVASKFLHDDGEDGVYNDEWAESAGIGTEAINELEREFLHAIDWNLLAREKEFQAKMEQLEQSVALRKGKERLWKLSYTDLWVFLRNLECFQLLKTNVMECLKVFGVVVSAYVLGVVVLLLSLSTVTAIRTKMMQKNPSPVSRSQSTHANKLTERLAFTEERLAAEDGSIYDNFHLNDVEDLDSLAAVDGQLGEEASVFEDDDVDDDNEVRRRRRPLCCSKWRNLLASQKEQRHRRSTNHFDNIAKMIHSSGGGPWSDIITPFSSSCCDCNSEMALARNLKIKENGFNASFQREKANDSWSQFPSSGNVDVDGDEKLAVNSPFRMVQVFG